LDIKLSDAATEHLLDKLETAEDEKVASKRRSERRDLRGVRLPITMRHDEDPVGVFHVRMRDISQHGVGFLSRAAISPGTAITVHLPLGPNGTSIDKHAVVRRCSHVDGMIYDIGAEFGEAHL
jgi:hypothetical protein